MIGDRHVSQLSRIADLWAQDAIAEHASIASFARFTLELLALGAPSDLVLSALDAGRDEVKHTRMCFSIASRLAGRSLGPGILKVDGAVASSSLVDAAVSAAREGCIGETISAVLASVRYRSATDPEIRTILHQISEDEARHAYVAWRFLEWTIQKGGATVRNALQQVLTSQNAPMYRRDDSDKASLQFWGLLDDETAYEATCAVHRWIITPCSAMLFSEVLDAKTFADLMVASLSQITM